MPRTIEPDWTHYVRTHLRLPAMPGHREQRIVGELAAHLEDVYRDARSRGASEEEAMAEAERRLDDPDLAARELAGTEPSPVGAALYRQAERRDARLRHRGGRWVTLPDVLRDVRDSVRSLRRRPGFTAVAILSLALGIGANSAVFTLVNLVMLRELPYERPAELVDIHTDLPSFSFSVVSYPDFEDLRDGTTEVFAGVVGS